MADMGMDGKPEGARLLQEAIDHGADPNQVHQWALGVSKEAVDKGAPINDVYKYWGWEKPSLEMGPVEDHIRQGFSQLAPEEHATVASSWTDAIAAGWQSSVTGLLSHGKPTTVLPENAGLFSKILDGAGQMVGDLPAMAAGGVGGGAAGSTIGPLGTLMGTGAGAAAVPQAMRSAIMDVYNKNPGPVSWHDLWSGMSKVAWEEVAKSTGKAALAGALGGAAGGVAGNVVSKVGAPLLGDAAAMVAGKTANLVGFGAASTEVGAALEGKIPTKEDIIAGVALTAGFGLAHSVVGLKGATERPVTTPLGEQIGKNLQDAYVATGLSPKVLGEVASKDAAVREELLAPKSADGTRVTPLLDQTKLDEPKPYTTGPKVLDEEGNEVPPPEPKDPLAPPATTPEVAESRMLTVQGDDGEWEPPPSALVEKAEGGGGGGKPPVEMPLPAAGEEPNREFQKNNDYRKKVIESLIGEPEKVGILKQFGGSVRRAIAAFQGVLTPARQLDLEFGLLGPHTEEGQIKAPGDFGIEAGFRAMLSSRGVANFFLRKGGLTRAGDRYQRNDVPAFTDAYKAVKDAGGNTHDFYLWQIANRVVEKARQGLDITGDRLDLGLALDHIHDADNIRMYQRGSDLLAQAKDGVVDFYRDSGMLSPERAEAMKQLNRYHISFNRVVNPDYQIGMGRNTTRQVKRIGESDLDIRDPALADIDNLHSMIANANRNVAIGNMIGFLKLKNENNNFLTRIDPKVMGIDLDRDALLRGEVLDPSGKVLDLSPNQKEALAPLLAQRAFNGVRGANDFIYFNKGVPELWRATDDRVADLIRNTQHAYNPKTGFAVMRWMSRIAGYGIGMDPDFILRSASHGQVAQAVAGENSSPPFVQLMRGLPDAFKDLAGLNVSEQYKDFLAHGGGTALTDMDKIMKAGDMDFLARETGLRERVWNVVKSPIEAMQAISHVVHTAAQYGNYREQLKAGASPLRAYDLASTNLLDFREDLASPVAQEFSQWVRFMGVGLKDIEQFGRAMQTPQGRLRMLQHGITYLTLPAIALSIINNIQDQNLPAGQRYKDLPQYIRDGYFVFPQGPGGVRFKWPKPYVLNYMFTAIPERFIDHMFGQDPRSAAENLQEFAQSFIPPAVPNAVVPIGEQLMNQKFISGTPLIPAAMENLTGYRQYGPTTSPEAIALAKIVGQPRFGGPGLNVSPVVLDEYMKQWGGSTVYEIAHAIHGQFQPASSYNQGWEHDLFTKGFFITHSDYSPKPIEDAYSVIKEFNESHADFLKAKKEGDLTALLPSTTQMAFERVNMIQKDLKNVRQGIQMINAAPDMSLNDKQKNIDAIYTNFLPALEQTIKEYRTLAEQAYQAKQAGGP